MKEFKITEEQIKKLHKNEGSKYVKEWFPEVFETKMEVGRWYKHKEFKNILAFFETNKNGAFSITGYGISENKKWTNGASWTFVNKPQDWRLATEEEVFEALKKEFKKQNPNVFYYSISYEIDSNILSVKINDFFYEVFNNGNWVTLATKEEAEKQLNVKIID